MSAYDYSTVDHIQWIDHPLEDDLYINNNKADGYKEIDGMRWAGDATVVRFVFDDGSKTIHYCSGFFDMYELHKTVNPIVFQLRDQFGTMHKIQDGNLVEANDGKLKLVPTSRFEAFYFPILFKCSLHKLDRAIQEKGLKDFNTFVDYIRRILRVRFHVSHEFVQSLSPSKVLEHIASNIAHECNVGYNALLKKIVGDPNFSLWPQASTTVRVNLPSNNVEIIATEKYENHSVHGTGEITRTTNPKK